jgi:hypothetical protein
MKEGEMLSLQPKVTVWRIGLGALAVLDAGGAKGDQFLDGLGQDEFWWLLRPCCILSTWLPEVFFNAAPKIT